VPLFLYVSLVLASVRGQALTAIMPRDVRSWSNPMTENQTVTFSTPESYEACPLAGTSDTLIASGIPAEWQLNGRVWLTYSDGNSRIDIPGGQYSVAFVSPQSNSSLSFEVPYPSAEEWPSKNTDLTQRELHVDLAIVVTDEHGKGVPWIGGDLVHAPGTLGPGGQDWSVICSVPALALFMPLISS
jgi:hypothetical protein